MPISKLLVILLLLGGSGVVLESSLSQPTGAPGSDPPVCDQVALAVRSYGEDDARAKLWLDVARILNDSPSDPNASLLEAWDDYVAALECVRSQYEARLLACQVFGQGTYDPEINPAQFSPVIENRYFPLVPGRTWEYEGRTAEGLLRIEATVLPDTVVIADVECRALHTVETVDGRLVEDTLDWFAQHSNGDVWYFGELSKTFDEEGFLDSIDGSWRAGREGAKPGIKMLGNAVVNDSCRMEYHIGDAEDIIRVISLDATAVTAHGTFTNCVQVEEWSPLEGERETKYFAPGIGLVLEINHVTGERLELVQSNR